MNKQERKQYEKELERVSEVEDRVEMIMPLLADINASLREIEKTDLSASRRLRKIIADQLGLATKPIEYGYSFLNDMNTIDIQRQKYEEYSQGEKTDFDKIVSFEEASRLNLTMKGKTNERK